ncbi:unnamed protein product [Urochloa decumbens]|uniref:DUF4220 domain-containing protein n=1 Tax=Urochloa decumbens TaxID=240449 RepID=A0ABC8WW01_9POAL
MGLSSAVKWWEEWQLRILVLNSLLLQFVLFVGSLVRYRRIPSFFRSCIWLAHLGADGVAIYALTTLFNQQQKQPGTTDGSSRALEALWAPILLIHIGGQHRMTAYSIEDNELWGRHLMSMVSQVAVVTYVCCKVWPGGDRRLLQAVILLFIVGTLRFAQKILALNGASISSVMSASAVYPSSQARNKIISGFFISCLTSLSFNDGESLKEDERNDISLEDYVQKAREGSRGAPSMPQHEVFPLDIEKLFVDLSAPYARRLRKLKDFLLLHRIDAYQKLQLEIRLAFELIHTNLKVVLSFNGCLLHLFLPFLSLASTVLFTTASLKRDFQDNDVRVTVILLWCTTLLDFLPFFSSHCIVGRITRSNTVAQHNLASYIARECKPTNLMKISAAIGCKDIVNKHWYIEHASESDCINVMGLVKDHVSDGWTDYITDAASYKAFNSLRGQWALRRRNVHVQRLQYALQVPFDQSVLIWHIATELCIHRRGALSQADAARCSRVISNYMIYLLFIRPEMLMPGTRQGLFTTACYDIIMLKRAQESQSQAQNGGGGGSVLDDLHTALPFPSTDDVSLFARARRLAEDLMDLLGDEDERWKVIQGVWVEIMCYSASRCRGYLHAKSMAEGVEFLTVVWLLLSYMGMETFADKFQRSEPAEELVTATSLSQPQEMHPRDIAII